jgi:hypothetical protein
MGLQLSTTRENVIDTCHEQDFGLSAEWHFFATSHENREADRIGGAVKRLAAKANLHTTCNNQIQTPHELFNYCKSNTHNIKFSCDQEEQILKYKHKLAE